MPAFTKFWYTDNSTSISNDTTITTSSFSGAVKWIDFGSAVTSIANNTFQSISSVTSVYFDPSTVSLSIGANAFKGCNNLFNLTFSNGNTTVGDSAFSGIKATDITIPSTMTSYTNAFQNITTLNLLIISPGATTISPGAFKGCTALATLIGGPNVADTVTSIGENAFQNCGLTGFSCPLSLVTIGGLADNPIVSIELIAGVQTIGPNAFNGCTNLTTVTTLGTGITTIGNGAFQGCTKLATMNLSPHTGLNSLGSAAFQDCYLYNVPIPPNLTVINNNTFMNCRALTTITIPSVITSIGASAFAGCYGIGATNLPAGLTTIGASAFEGCSNITFPTFPTNITSLGASAFLGCAKLTSFSIPTAITTVPNSLLQNCSLLSSVSIHSSVTSYGNYSFAGCSNLRSITHPSGLLSIGTGCFQSSGIRTTTLPTGITILAASLFQGCVDLSSVVLSGAITAVGNNAFDGCSKLPAISLPNTISAMGTAVFQNCVSLASIIFPSSINTINANMMNGCTSLVSASIPFGVLTIGTNAFFGCTKLPLINIPNSVTTVGTAAFSGCTKLATVNFSESVLNLQNNSFNNCGFISLELPPRLTTLGNGSIGNAANLTNISIPESIVSFGNSMFVNCPSLAIVLFPGTSNLTTVSTTNSFTGTTPQLDVRFTGVSSYAELNAASKTLATYMGNTGKIRVRYGPPCFLGGTLILAMIDYCEKWVPIESLRAGDYVKTYIHGFVPIERIGYKDIVVSQESNENSLYKYTKGSSSCPELFEDLVVTGTHSVLVPKLSEVQSKKVAEVLGKIYITDDMFRLPACVDERALPYETSPDATYRVYHFALEHASPTKNYGVYANGMLAESSSRRYMTQIANMVPL